MRMINRAVPLCVRIISLRIHTLDSIIEPIFIYISGERLAVTENWYLNSDSIQMEGKTSTLLY